jgi:hypothetical protein
MVRQPKPLPSLGHANPPRQLFSLSSAQSMMNHVAALSVRPEAGSTFLFLLAGPGETQMLFTRAADVAVGASRGVGSVQLGGSTWFQEPVYMVLSAIASSVEQLQNAGLCAALGEPPLQVCAITDGMDNQSVELLSTLPKLCDAISQIQGPSGAALYQPMGSWGGKDGDMVEAGDKVPVWLLWVAAGNGAQDLLDQVRAIPECLRAPDLLTHPLRATPLPPRPRAAAGSALSTRDTRMLQGARSPPTGKRGKDRGARRSWARRSSGECRRRGGSCRLRPRYWRSCAKATGSCTCAYDERAIREGRGRKRAASLGGRRWETPRTLGFR